MEDREALELWLAVGVLCVQTEGLGQMLGSRFGEASWVRDALAATVGEQLGGSRLAELRDTWGWSTPERLVSLETQLGTTWIPEIPAGHSRPARVDRWDQGMDQLRQLSVRLSLIEHQLLSLLERIEHLDSAVADDSPDQLSLLRDLVHVPLSRHGGPLGPEVAALARAVTGSGVADDEE